MDPFGALSLVCNVCDLAERAYKTGKIIKDTYSNANGQQKNHAQIENHVEDMERLRNELNYHSAQLAQTSLNQRLGEALDRSQEATEALRTILDECRARKPGSLRHSIMAVSKSLFKTSSIQAQLDKLKECRDKLQMLLVINTNEQVENIVQILERTGSDLQPMRTNLQEVHGRFIRQNGGTDLVLNFDKLKVTTQETILRFNANRILRGLNLQHARYDEVVDASPFTYRWIYDVHGSLMPQVMVQAKENIRSWLSTGAGVLHIAGKPGAGKSTLTKFIVKNDHTLTLLRRWSGTKPLVVVKFFFWKPGNWQQNTLRGLKRSIVAQVLQAAPELSLDLFPRLCQTELSMGLLERPSIDLEDVTMAFEKLLGLQRTGILDPYRLCLFLDGLDEFEEAAENINHSDLMRLIIGWIEASDGRVKAFVSSRQLPVFNGIAVTHRIKLQDVTYGDIMDHINGSLEKDKSFQQLRVEDPNGCKMMIQELAQRADGIFLWVTLVIKSIQRGLSNCDPLTKLRAVIQETPEGLDRLVSQILREIAQGPYRKEACILLAIALKGVSEEVTESDGRVDEPPAKCPFIISLLAAGSLFTAMDSGLELRQIFQKAIANPPHCEKYGDEALNTAMTQLSGRCLGLLEVVHDANFGIAVKFLHRSIPEYLEQRVSKQLEELGINSVDVMNVMACMVSTDVYYCLSIDREIATSGLFQAFLHLSPSKAAGQETLPTILINACSAGLTQYIDWALCGNRAEYATRLYQQLLLRYACDGVLRGEPGCSETGARPACFLIWHLHKDEAKREELRCWLRGGGNNDYLEKRRFRIHSLASKEPLGHAFGHEAELATEVKSFLADLLAEAEKSPIFEQELSITITFDDVIDRFYSKETGQSSSSLRVKKPAMKIPESPRSTPIRSGGFSILLLSIVVFVGAMLLTRVLFSNRNAASPQDT
ncbi:hypothetical protein PG989_010261 [Apiospora arundinis]